MSLSANDWHQRFRQQAAWTEQVREFLLARLAPGEHSRILEVGCGTGAITTGLHRASHPAVFGLDLNPTFLRLAHQNDPSTRFSAGDALHLPYPDAAFDITVCHYFLLWIRQPEAALAEMRRVTRPGGSVIAFAEPDYGGRIDYPEALAEVGRLQADALHDQGADPHMGRKLSGLFHADGLHDVQTGLMGGQWQGAPTQTALDSEWSILQADLIDSIPMNRLHDLRQLDEQAWQSGARVLFVPTFYAIGKR